MHLQELSILFVTICSIQVIEILADDLSSDNLEKRTPGWGKREAGAGAARLGYLQSVISDFSRYDSESEDREDLELAKRRPGWGKRDFNSEDEMAKRRPGWGKRASQYDVEHLEEEKRRPGWGKRDSSLDSDDLSESVITKRKPGWGKRGSYDDFTMDKRRPGWGKRTPGWGKRSSHSIDKCQTLINDIQLLRLKLYQLTEDFQDSCPEPYMTE